MKNEDDFTKKEIEDIVEIINTLSEKYKGAMCKLRDYPNVENVDEELGFFNGVKKSTTHPFLERVASIYFKKLKEEQRIRSTPTYQAFRGAFEKMKKAGEPGVINFDNLKSNDDKEDNPESTNIYAVVEDILSRYETVHLCPKYKDGTLVYGEGVLLEDVMTPDDQLTTKVGKKEVTSLAGFIVDELDDQGLLNC